jgi:hypothetical protein
MQNEANVKLENPDLAGGCVASPGFVIHVTKCGALQRSAALCGALQRNAALGSALQRRRRDGKTNPTGGKEEGCMKGRARGEP